METPGNLTQNLFFGAIILFALAELLRPRRALLHDTRQRWIANIGLGGVSLILGRWILPLMAAAMAAASDFGLLTRANLPAVSKIGLGFLMLDAVAYGLHRLFHAVPLLWRLHLVHHSDRDLDFTTGFRHHPLEVLLISGLTLLAVIVLGIPPLAVLLYGAARAVVDIAAHANLALPTPLDRALRLIIITPDMHQIHHSRHQPETDSNFTQLLTVWDRLLGTYRSDAGESPARLQLGLVEWPEPSRRALWHVLTLPFRDPSPLSGFGGACESPDGPDEARPSMTGAAGSAGRE